MLGVALSGGGAKGFAHIGVLKVLEEVGLGLYPTGNATVLLPRQIGWVHAHDLLLSARQLITRITE